jgi:hypothetical protein
MPRNPDRIDALDENDRLRGVLTRAEALEVIESGRGVAVGRTCMKYIRLRPGVTLGQWLGGSRTTRMMRHEDGTVFRATLSREHLPVL